MWATAKVRLKEDSGIATLSGLHVSLKAESAQADMQHNASRVKLVDVTAVSEAHLRLTTADGLNFIQVQVKPERHRIHFASCDDFQLQNVVTASALALALKEVLKHLARLCQWGVSHLVQLAGLIVLIPPVHTPQKVLQMQA